MKEIYPLLRDIEDQQGNREPTIVKLPNGNYFSARDFDKFTGQVSLVFLDNLTSELAEGEPRTIWIARSGNIQGSRVLDIAAAVGP